MEQWDLQKNMIAISQKAVGEMSWERNILANILSKYFKNQNAFGNF